MLKWVQKYLSKTGFKFEETFATILSGEEEGVFGWLSVNLALGTLEDDSKKTAGAIDMGGLFKYSKILKGDFPKGNCGPIFVIANDLIEIQ